MGGSLPDYIEPRRCAEARARFVGRYALADMPEMAPYLHAEGGEARFDLRFDIDEEGVRFLNGDIAAALTTLCQRCMEPMAVEFTVNLRLGIVASEAEAGRLPAGYDPLIASGPVRLQRLVEDELVLNMPMTPKHPAGVCRPHADKREEHTAPHPFAALATLRKGEKAG